MEFIIHSCDFSPQCRDFKVAQEWTYLLFYEFFKQGDREKYLSLPITFLCDRDTTNVAKAQPGFSNFVVLPLYSQVVNFLPVVKECIDQIKSNAKTWETYEETEADKLVYVKKDTNADIVKVDQVDEEDEEGSDGGQIDSNDKKE